MHRPVENKGREEEQLRNTHFESKLSEDENDDEDGEEDETEDEEENESVALHRAIEHDHAAFRDALRSVPKKTKTNSANLFMFQKRGQKKIFGLSNLDFTFRRQHKSNSSADDACDIKERSSDNKTRQAQAGSEKPKAFDFSAPPVKEHDVANANSITPLTLKTLDNQVGENKLESRDHPALSSSNVPTSVETEDSEPSWVQASIKRRRIVVEKGGKNRQRPRGRSNLSSSSEDCINSHEAMEDFAKGKPDRYEISKPDILTNQEKTSAMVPTSQHSAKDDPKKAVRYNQVQGAKGIYALLVEYILHPVLMCAEVFSVDIPGFKIGGPKLAMCIKRNLDRAREAFDVNPKVHDATVREAAKKYGLEPQSTLPRLEALCMPKRLNSTALDHRVSSDHGEDLEDRESAKKHGIEGFLRPLVNAIKVAENRIAIIKDKVSKMSQYSEDNFAHKNDRQRFLHTEEKQYTENLHFLVRCRKQLLKEISKARKQEKKDMKRNLIIEAGMSNEEAFRVIESQKKSVSCSLLGCLNGTNSAQPRKELPLKKQKRIRDEATRTVEALRAIEASKKRALLASRLEAEQEPYSATDDAMLAITPIDPEQQGVDARSLYVLLYKVLLQHANPNMTTPETSDPTGLAGNVEKIGEAFGVYTHNREASVNTSSHLRYFESIKVNKEKGIVEGVDTGRMPDGGDFHSLCGLDEISRQISREFAYQIGICGVFDKLAPLVILTANLRGALSLSMQIQDYRREHLFAVKEALYDLGMDQVTSRAASQQRKKKKKGREDKAKDLLPLTLVESDIMQRIVLGTLTSIISDVLSHYDKHFEVDMSGTLTKEESDCLNEAVLVYVWLCKIRHIQDFAKYGNKAVSALRMFLEGIKALLKISASLHILEVRCDSTWRWTSKGLEQLPVTKSEVNTSKEIQHSILSTGSRYDSKSTSSERSGSQKGKHSPHKFFNRVFHKSPTVIHKSAKSSVDTNTSLARISRPYSISIPPHCRLGFRIDSTLRIGGTHSGCVVSSVTSKRLTGVLGVGDKILSINGWSCLTASIESVRIQLDVLPRPLVIVFLPETRPDSLDRSPDGNILNYETKAITLQNEAISKQRRIVRVTRDVKSCPEFDNNSPVQDDLKGGMLDLIITPPSKAGKPPRVSGFNGREQCGRVGPCESSGQIQIGDGILSINGVSTEGMQVEHVRHMLVIAASGSITSGIRSEEHGGRIWRQHSAEKGADPELHPRIDDGDMYEELMAAGLPVGTVALEMERRKSQKHIRAYDSCGNVRTEEDENSMLGPAYTAEELKQLLDDISLLLRSDLLFYGKAFNVREIVENHFHVPKTTKRGRRSQRRRSRRRGKGGRKYTPYDMQEAKMHPQEVVNRVFMLPSAVWKEDTAEQWSSHAVSNSSYEVYGKQKRSNTDLWNLDPVFAVRVGTLWREVVAQIQRFVKQNGQSDAPNEMLQGWIEMVESAKRVQELVMQGGVTSSRESEKYWHTGMVDCLVEGERQAMVRNGVLKDMKFKFSNQKSNGENDPKASNDKIGQSDVNKNEGLNAATSAITLDLASDGLYAEGSEYLHHAQSEAMSPTLKEHYSRHAHERDVTISQEPISGILNFENLFSRFCVRWLEQRFDYFMKDVVPELLKHNEGWEPVGTDKDSKWCAAAKDLRFFVATSQKMFDTIPGHKQYPNIVRFGKHMICDVVAAFAEIIAEDFHMAVVDILENDRSAFGWLFGLGGAFSNDAEVFKNSKGNKRTHQELLLFKGQPLCVRMNTVMYLCDELMTMLQELNNLDGVEGFMEDSDSESDDEHEEKLPLRRTSFARADSTDGLDWAEDLDDTSVVYKNLKVCELKLTLYEGRKIPKLDYLGFSACDPYLLAIIFDGERSSAVHHTMKRTTAIHNSTHPVWGHVFQDFMNVSALEAHKGRSSRSSDEKNLDAVFDGGEELFMTTATPKATLFLQLFDEHDDKDKLIGNVEIDLERYAEDSTLISAEKSNSSSKWLRLTHPKKPTNSHRGEIRVGISFVKRDLGPGAMRSLNNTLTRMMEAPTWGFVNLLRPAIIQLYKIMIIGDNHAQNELTSDECTPSEVLSWRVGQSLYSAMNPSREHSKAEHYREARRIRRLQKDIHELIEAAAAEDTDCEGILKNLKKNGDEEEHEYYQNVIDDFVEFIDKIDIDPSGLSGNTLLSESSTWQAGDSSKVPAPGGGVRGRLACYADQYLRDKVLVEKRYHESKLKWFIEQKIVGLSQLCSPKIFAKLLLKLWRALMEASLNLLLPTQKSAGGAGIPLWNTKKKGPRPRDPRYFQEKVKRNDDKEAKKQKKKGWFHRVFRAHHDNSGSHLKSEDSRNRKTNHNMYLSRSKVRLMRLAHDHLLEQLGAGGSPYGLKRPLACRELGNEVVTLTEIWLDTCVVVSLAAVNAYRFTDLDARCLTQYFTHSLQQMYFTYNLNFAKHIVASDYAGDCYHSC